MGNVDTVKSQASKEEISGILTDLSGQSLRLVVEIANRLLATKGMTSLLTILRLYQRIFDEDAWVVKPDSTPPCITLSSENVSWAKVSQFVGEFPTLALQGGIPLRMSLWDDNTEPEGACLNVTLSHFPEKEFSFIFDVDEHMISVKDVLDFLGVSPADTTQ